MVEAGETQLHSTESRVVGGVPRLARHSFTLSDGYKVGLAVAGRGVPLVVVHGFTAEGFLYAQTLHRLVSKGFKVIAIDMAGHGGTQGIPAGGGRLGDYADLMDRCIGELGIRKAVLAGHSMGGRIVAQLAAVEPERAIAVVLIDAIVGDQWDLMVNVARVSPPVLATMSLALLVDSLTTMPFIADPAQARKLGNLAIPTLQGHLTNPKRLIGPAVSMFRSRGSRRSLDRLAADETPTFVIHGDRDMLVPLCAARSAAKRTNGVMIRVHKARHGWILRDPETLPAIVDELLDGRLGDAIRAELPAAGADSTDDLESIFYEPDAPILELTPDDLFMRRSDGSLKTTGRGKPLYRWTFEDL